MAGNEFKQGEPTVKFCREIWRCCCCPKTDDAEIYLKENDENVENKLLALKIKQY